MVTKPLTTEEIWAATIVDCVHRIVGRVSCAAPEELEVVIATLEARLTRIVNGAAHPETVRPLVKACITFVKANLAAKEEK